MLAFDELTTLPNHPHTLIEIIYSLVAPIRANRIRPRWNLTQLKQTGYSLCLYAVMIVIMNATRWWWAHIRMESCVCACICAVIVGTLASKQQAPKRSLLIDCSVESNWMRLVLSPPLATITIYQMMHMNVGPKVCARTQTCTLIMLIYCNGACVKIGILLHTFEFGMNPLICVHTSVCGVLLKSIFPQFVQLWYRLCYLITRLACTTV